jgi:hypothetical protein
MEIPVADPERESFPVVGVDGVKPWNKSAYLTVCELKHAHHINFCYDCDVLSLFASYQWWQLLSKPGLCAFSSTRPGLTPCWDMSRFFFGKPMTSQATSKSLGSPIYSPVLMHIDRVEILKNVIAQKIAELRAIAVDPVDIPYADGISFEVRPAAEDDQFVVYRKKFGCTSIDYQATQLSVDIFAEDV